MSEEEAGEQGGRRIFFLLYFIGLQGNRRQFPPARKPPAALPLVEEELTGLSLREARFRNRLPKSCCYYK